MRQKGGRGQQREWPPSLGWDPIWVAGHSPSLERKAGSLPARMAGPGLCLLAGAPGLLWSSIRHRPLRGEPGLEHKAVLLLGAPRPPVSPPPELLPLSAGRALRGGSLDFLPGRAEGRKAAPAVGCSLAALYQARNAHLARPPAAGVRVWRRWNAGGQLGDPHGPERGHEGGGARGGFSFAEGEKLPRPGPAQFLSAKPPPPHPLYPSPAPASALGDLPSSLPRALPLEEISRGKKKGL